MAVALGMKGASTEGCHVEMCRHGAYAGEAHNKEEAARNSTVDLREELGELGVHSGSMVVL